jgi:hypothetical protein
MSPGPHAIGGRVALPRTLDGLSYFASRVTLRADVLAVSRHRLAGHLFTLIDHEGHTTRRSVNRCTQLDRWRSPVGDGPPIESDSWTKPASRRRRLVIRDGSGAREPRPAAHHPQRRSHCATTSSLSTLFEALPGSSGRSGKPECFAPRDLVTVRAAVRSWMVRDRPGPKPTGDMADT